MTTYANLVVEKSEGIATLTFTRESAMNALNAATFDDISAALDALDRETRGLILTGAGKAFVAGADIASMPSMSPAEAEAFSARGTSVFSRLEALTIPVIAAVNGFALGGGCELALACDFIYASSKARFGQPEVQLGLVPGFGGTQRLPRKVGHSVAMELLLSGRMIKADEALRIGLVNRVLDPEELLPATRATMLEILSKGPLAVAATKRLVHRALETDLGEGLTEESTSFGAIFETRDAREGVQAFLDKRSPDFTGA